MLYTACSYWGQQWCWPSSSTHVCCTTRALGWTPSSAMTVAEFSSLALPGTQHARHACAGRRQQYMSTRIALQATKRCVFNISTLHPPDHTSQLGCLSGFACIGNAHKSSRGCSAGAVFLANICELGTDDLQGAETGQKASPGVRSGWRYSNGARCPANCWQGGNASGSASDRQC